MALAIPISDYDSALEAVCAAILAGGIVIYPTDTLYGIGCDATNATAVEKIRKLKKRDGEKPFSIIVSDFEMLKKYCEINGKQSHALQALLPGPYTFILPLKKPLPASGGKTIGVRVPGHIFMRAVSKRLQLPIVSTSANFSGEKEAAEASEIAREIADGADLLIEGGKCQYSQGSTVIDLIENKVLRKGAIRQGDKFEWEDGK